MADLIVPEVESTPQIVEKPQEVPKRGLRERFSFLRKREPRQVLEDFKNNTASETENLPVLSDEIQMESVGEALEVVENVALLDKAKRWGIMAKDKAVSLSPAIGASVGVMAISQLAGGHVSSEAANLLLTATAGGFAGVDGGKLRSELKSAADAKQIGKNAALALLFMKGMQASHVPLPDTLAAFVDDAALPLMKLLPMMSIRPGGIR